MIATPVLVIDEEPMRGVIRRFRIRAVIPIIVLLLALASSACTSRDGGPGTGPARQLGNVAELRGVSELKQRFDEDSGKVRLILLISPT